MTKEKNLTIYTVTIIRVMTYEACEYKTVPFMDRDKAIKFYNSSLGSWLKEREQFETENYDPDFNIDDWQKESLYAELDLDDYKLVHYTFNEGDEKIFELKAHEV